MGRPLASPSALGANREVSQVVRGAFGARELTINCVVTVKDGALTVIGLNALGLRLFTLRQDASGVHVEQPMSGMEQLPPQRLLADLQMVFWPFAGLREPLQQAGWQLTEPAPGTRRLRRGDRLVAEAHFSAADPWSGRSWLVSFEHGYSLQIDSRALQ
jgi:hypothetical protein